MQKDRDGGDQEDRAQDVRRVPLEELHQIVADECDDDLDHDHDEQREHGRHPGERGECERSADRVDGEPAEAGHDRVERGGQDVAAVAERCAADDHLGQTLPRPPGREDALRGGPERGPDDEREHRLPESEPEERDCDHADEDGRELEVRRRPGRHQLPRRAVSALGGDRLDPAATRYWLRWCAGVRAGSVSIVGAFVMQRSIGAAGTRARGTRPRTSHAVYIRQLPDARSLSLGVWSGHGRRPDGDEPRPLLGALGERRSSAFSSTRTSPARPPPPHDHPNSVMVTLTSFRRRLLSGEPPADVELPAGRAGLARCPTPLG